MTTRRRLLLFGLLAGLLAMAAGVWLLWPRTAITRENAARIQEGMTRQEVESILGGPQRVEVGGKTMTGGSGTSRVVHVMKPGVYAEFPFWVSVEAWIVVSFDENERVRAGGVECRSVVRNEESPLDKLRRWLRL
jgi:hypothetical protein